jgi:hypothetical protein
MFTPAFRSFRPSSLLKNERLISGLAFRRAVNEVFSATPSDAVGENGEEHDLRPVGGDIETIVRN